MNKLLQGLFASVGLASASAFAAVPASVTTALTDASTDAATVATAVVVMGFAIWGIKYLSKGK